MGFPVLGVVTTVANAASGLLSNPQDAQRKQEADRLFGLAVNGDHVAEVKLRCLSGDQSVRQEAIGLNLLSPAEVARNQECGFATDSARAYARGLVAQLGVRSTVATGAGVVTAGAAQVGVTASPGQYVSTVAGAGLPVAFGSIPWGTLAIIGVGLYLALSSRK